MLCWPFCERIFADLTVAYSQDALFAIDEHSCFSVHDLLLAIDEHSHIRVLDLLHTIGASILVLSRDRPNNNDDCSHVFSQDELFNICGHFHIPAQDLPYIVDVHSLVGTLCMCLEDHL